MSTSEELRETLGEIIRRQRELAELPMRQFAAMVGISNPYLSQIENGARVPSDQVLRSIATSLGLRLDDLRSPASPDAQPGVLAAIKTDTDLTPQQRRALAEVYESMTAATRAERAAEA